MAVEAFLHGKASISDIMSQHNGMLFYLNMLLQVQKLAGPVVLSDIYRVILNCLGFSQKFRTSLYILQRTIYMFLYQGWKIVGNDTIHSTI
jgi:hypothetical protein